MLSSNIFLTWLEPASLWGYFCNEFFVLNLTAAVLGGRAGGDLVLWLFIVNALLCQPVIVPVVWKKKKSQNKKNKRMHHHLGFGVILQLSKKVIVQLRSVPAALGIALDWPDK